MNWMIKTIITGDILLLAQEKRRKILEYFEACGLAQLIIGHTEPDDSLTKACSLTGCNSSFLPFL